jgi:metal-dependent hydrolase (beta-lactamase superfamily II)
LLTGCSHSGVKRIEREKRKNKKKDYNRFPGIGKKGFTSKGESAVNMR